MRIWRLDIGLARKPRTRAIAWDWGIYANRGTCGCWVFSVGPIYITWLSNKENGCYSYSIVHLKKKSKAKKAKRLK